MTTRTERAKTFFSNPDLYLRGNHRVSLRAHFVRELLGDVRNSRILDLGCGDGRISAQFLPAGNHVTMLDLSDGMLERVKNNVPTEYAARVNYVKSDIFAFNPGAVYDVVLCIGVLAGHPQCLPVQRPKQGCDVAYEGYGQFAGVTS